MIGFALLATVAVARAEVAGGSNYGWYAVEGCRALGILPAWDREATKVEEQLRAMHASGQRRLRLPLIFSQAPVEDTITISAAGLSEPDRGKIRTLLALIRRIGFEEIVFGIFSQANSHATPWKTWQEDRYQENWRTIRQVRALLVESGVPYRLDLLNEGIPAAGDAMLLAYTQRLWADYTTAFGTQDTVGFSLIPEEPRVANVPRVYRGTYPPVFDIHIYENAAERVRVVKRMLNARDLGRIPWIVGETFYDDPTATGEIRSATAAARVDLLYILQWPVTRQREACQNVTVVPLKPVPGPLRPSR